MTVYVPYRLLSRGIPCTHPLTPSPPTRKIRLPTTITRTGWLLSCTPSVYSIWWIVPTALQFRRPCIQYSVDDICCVYHRINNVQYDLFSKWCGRKSPRTTLPHHILLIPVPMSRPSHEPNLDSTDGSNKDWYLIPNPSSLIEEPYFNTDPPPPRLPHTHPSPQ